MKNIPESFSPEQVIEVYISETERMRRINHDFYLLGGFEDDKGESVGTWENLVEVVYGEHNPEALKDNDTILEFTKRRPLGRYRKN